MQQQVLETKHNTLVLSEVSKSHSSQVTSLDRYKEVSQNNEGRNVRRQRNQGSILKVGDNPLFQGSLL